MHDIKTDIFIFYRFRSYIRYSNQLKLQQISLSYFNLNFQNYINLEIKAMENEIYNINASSAQESDSRGSRLVHPKLFRNASLCLTIGEIYKMVCD
jgi:hypothetical protein